MHSVTKVFITAALLFSVVNCKAQKEEFNISLADRVEETGLLNKSQWQVEGGYSRTNYETGTASDIGQLLLRYGLSGKVEVRVQTEQGKGRYRYFDETVQSNYPLSVGAKVKLLEHHAFLPDMTIVGYLNMPFTENGKNPKQHWSPIVFMAFQHHLTDKFSLSYNAGAQQEVYGTHWSAILNGSLHYEITNELEIFAEYFSQFQPKELPAQNLGSGLSYVLSRHLSVYAAGGSTIFTEEGNYFLTGGLAVKFPG